MYQEDEVESTTDTNQGLGLTNRGLNCLSTRNRPKRIDPSPKEGESYRITSSEFKTALYYMELYRETYNLGGTVVYNLFRKHGFIDYLIVEYAFVGHYPPEETLMYIEKAIKEGRRWDGDPKFLERYDCEDDAIIPWNFGKKCSGFQENKEHFKNLKPTKLPQRTIKNLSEDLSLYHRTSIISETIVALSEKCTKTTEEALELFYTSDIYNLVIDSKVSRDSVSQEDLITKLNKELEKLN